MNARVWNYASCDQSQVAEAVFSDYRLFLILFRSFTSDERTPVSPEPACKPQASRSRVLAAVLLFSFGAGAMPAAVGAQTHAPADAGALPPGVPVIKNDPVGSKWIRLRLDPVLGLLPTITAGALLGAVASSMRPDCVLPSSPGKAAVGAVWGGLQRKIGIWKRQGIPTRTHADRQLLDELCGERSSALTNHDPRRESSASAGRTDTA